ncbi:cation:proton antiporter [Methylocella sp.]|uniref:cation:proton antiporter n=1 Tax=Methylocella sp. TaxID=1978226 RepID=UPI003784090C
MTSSILTLAFDAFSVVAVSLGGFFFLAGALGLLRFPDPLCRLHALTKADTLGLGLIVLGLIPQAGGVAGALKLVAVWALAQIGAATSSQIVAGALRRRGDARREETGA